MTPYKVWSSPVLPKQRWCSEGILLPAVLTQTARPPLLGPLFVERRFLGPNGRRGDALSLVRHLQLMLLLLPFRSQLHALPWQQVSGGPCGVFDGG